MSANAHTAVMTDLEQRIQDGRQLSAPRPRINRIMEDRFYGRKPRVDIQRAVLFTQSMMQTEAYPQVLRTALAIQYMMEHIEVVIQPHELIVGTAGTVCYILRPGAASSRVICPRSSRRRARRATP